MSYHLASSVAVKWSFPASARLPYRCGAGRDCLICPSWTNSSPVAACKHHALGTAVPPDASRSLASLHESLQWPGDGLDTARDQLRGRVSATKSECRFGAGASVTSPGVLVDDVHTSSTPTHLHFDIISALGVAADPVLQARASLQGSACRSAGFVSCSSCGNLGPLFYTNATIMPV